MEDTLLWIVSVVCILVGLAGTVLPVMPGALLVFGGLWLAAWIEHYAYIGWGTLTVLGVLTALTYAIDFFAGIVGAQRFGASKWAITGSAIGTFLGIFFGLPGIILGPFLGAVAGELYMRKDLRHATQAGLGTTLGLAIGAVAKIALVMIMLGLCVIMRFI